MSPSIHPRIARRWVDARRAEGRRRLHILLAVGSLLMAAALAVGSLYTPLLRVRHLRVTVTGGGIPSEVTRLAGVTGHTLMIDVKAPTIAARLDADPLLGGAQVERVWPSTVRISVAARTPLAVVAVAGKWAEIDATGRVIANAAVQAAGLPMLQSVGSVPAVGAWLAGTPGPRPSPSTPASGLVDMYAPADGPDVPGGAGALLALIDALPAPLRSAVLTADAASPTGLVLTVAPPRSAVGIVTVLLGDGSLLAAKASALATMLDSADLSGVTGIDLSVPSRPAAETTSPPFGPPPNAAAASTSGSSTSGSSTSGSSTSGSASPGSSISGSSQAGTASAGGAGTGSAPGAGSAGSTPSGGVAASGGGSSGG